MSGDPSEVEWSRRETFPSEWLAAALPVGIAGTLLVLGAAAGFALQRRGRAAARFGLGLATILLAPLAVTTFGWAIDASSFELHAADAAPSYCLGVDDPTIHFWFRTSACPRWPEVVATVLGVAGAALGAVAAVRSAPYPALAAAAAGGAALATFVAWALLAGFRIQIQFLLPGLGIALLAASALALNTAPREALNSEGA